MNEKIAENTAKLPKKESIPPHLKSRTPKKAQPSPEFSQEKAEDVEEIPAKKKSPKQKSKLERITGVRLTPADELKVQELALKLAQSKGGKWNFSMTLRFLIRQADPELNGNWEEIADSVLSDDLKRKL